MSSRSTVLITGGTGSLGFHAAQAILADGGWDAVITGRAAVADAAARLGDFATGRRIDLGSLADVRRFARDLPPLNAVICNAGLMTVSGTKFTLDGIEETFGVNHLAHFLLVGEVLPKMPAPGRVVFVSSATHDPAQRTGFPAPRYTTARQLAHPGDADAEHPMHAGRARYAASKLCNVLAAYEFARRVPADVATFNAFDPGQMPGTGLARDHHGFRAFAWHRVMPALTLVPGINRHTPKQSGAALARLVLDPRLADTSGKYFNGKREVRSSAESYDTRKAADLWQTSITLTSNGTGSGSDNGYSGHGPQRRGLRRQLRGRRQRKLLTPRNVVVPPPCPSRPTTVRMSTPSRDQLRGRVVPQLVDRRPDIEPSRSRGADSPALLRSSRPAGVPRQP